MIDAILAILDLMLIKKVQVSVYNALQEPILMNMDLQSANYVQKVPIKILKAKLHVNLVLKVIFKQKMGRHFV